jgi:hypothetical protein
VNSGSYGVVAGQSFLSYTSNLLKVVQPGETNCVVTNTIEPDTAVFDDVTQNEVCNGPANCSYRGNNVPAGSIAFASGALNNCPSGCHGDFRVASITLCGMGQGTAHILWQFSPPSPPERESAILDLTEHVASYERSMYVDYAVQVGDPGTPSPSSTPTPLRTFTTATPGRPTLTPGGATPTPGGATPTLAASVTPAHFSDVSPSDYFYVPAMYLAEHGVISGYSDGTFRPYNNTTRGQLSKIVVLSDGWTIDTTGGPHFSDVSPDSPFYSYIETAYNHSIISGYSDGTFHWGNNVTRGQLSKIVVSAEGWAIDTIGGPHFSDVPSSHPFYGYIETAYSRSILSGYTDGTFRPGNNATRGQIAKIVYLAITSP